MLNNKFIFLDIFYHNVVKEFLFNEGYGKALFSVNGQYSLFNSDNCLFVVDC